MTNEDDEIEKEEEELTPEEREAFEAFKAEKKSETPPAPPTPIEEEQHQRPRRRAPRQATSEEWQLMVAQNQLNRNVLNDDILKDGVPLDDFSRDAILMRVRDLCLEYNISWNKELCLATINTVADRNQYNPVKWYFEHLPAWDKIDRIRQLADHNRTADGSDPYRKYQIWSCGVFRRVYECKQNFTIILSGPGGLGKSTEAKSLCALPAYFGAGALNFKSKDCLIRLVTELVHEIPEFETTYRKDPVGLNAHLSLEVVRERRPYRSCDLLKPALTSFIATSEKSLIFHDDVTHRRFLTINLEKIDENYQQLDWAQYWAQIKENYREGAFEISQEEKQRIFEENETHVLNSPTSDILSSYFEIDEEAPFLPNSFILSFLRERGLTVDHAMQCEIARWASRAGAEKTSKKVKKVTERGFMKLKLKR